MRSNTRTPSWGSATNSVIRLASRRSTVPHLSSGVSSARATPLWVAVPWWWRVRRNPSRRSQSRSRLPWRTPRLHDPGVRATRPPPHGTIQGKAQRGGQKAYGRGFRQRAALQRHASAHPSGKFIHCREIIGLQFRVVIEDFFFGQARTEPTEHVPYGDAQPPNAGLTRALAGLNHDSGRHFSSISLAPAPSSPTRQCEAALPFYRIAERAAQRHTAHRCNSCNILLSNFSWSTGAIRDLLASQPMCFYGVEHARLSTGHQPKPALTWENRITTAAEATRPAVEW